MSKDPAFLFYTQDFITGTMFMSNEQTGIYIKLLCAQHQHGGLIDKVAFNAMVGPHDIIRSKFTETEDGFFNNRLMSEIVKRNSKSSNLSANAMQRWNKIKKEICKSDAIALQGDMPTEDASENENVDLNVLVLNEDRFLVFWDMYDKKVGKPATLKQWNKLTEAEKQKVMDVTPDYVQSKPDKGFRLHPERFLKYKSFNDEIIEAKNGTDRKNGGASPNELAAIVARRFEREKNGN